VVRKKNGSWAYFINATKEPPTQAYRAVKNQTGARTLSDVHHNKAVIYNTGVFNLKTTYYPIKLSYCERMILLEVFIGTFTIPIKSID
jgi:hypothetical protein